MSNIDKSGLREELLNPAIGSNAHLRKLALALLDELEAANVLNKHLELAIRRAEGCSEALRRKTEAAEKRIAELEAREVKMPDVEKWRSPEAVRAQNAYRVLVGRELSAAGIITKVGE